MSNRNNMSTQNHLFLCPKRGNA